LCAQKLNKRVAFVREIIREVAGYSPYEKRCMELLKVGKEKRALKVLKNKLGVLSPAAHHLAAPVLVSCLSNQAWLSFLRHPGTHKRAKAKREEMSGALRNQRMK